MDREATFKILEVRLSRAQERNKDASTQFNAILREMFDVAHPDGMASFERAARSYRQAMRDLWTAQEQMAQFLLRDVAPSDLDTSLWN